MLKKMKLGGIVLASLLAVTGCQNEEIVSNEQQKGNYSLNVSSLVDSRTYVENDGTVKWSKGDKLYVYGEGVSGVLTLQGNGGGTTGTFSGFVFGDPDDLKWAVFGDEVKGTADGAQFTISSITDPNSNSPMVGEIEGGDVQMNHLCGMVRITINNLPEGANVKLSGEDIAGTAEVKDGELSTSVSYESEITIKVAAGNQTIEVPVFASETESVKGFTLTIDNATFEFSAPIAVGKLSQDAIMNFDCVVNEETGKVEGFAIEVGTEEALYNALQTGIGESVSISLNKDIALTGTWTPIGNKDAGEYFTGTLNGNGHTISGLSVSEGDYVSLISAAKDATIKNLTVEGSVTGDNAAGIVARVEGNSIIENCISNVTVNGTTKAGGIVSNVTGADAKIINSVNNGAVSCSKEAAGGVGGIIGYVNTNAKVEVVGCTNNGNITGTDEQTTGAVIGFAAANSSGLIVSFTNTGNISGHNYKGDNLDRWIENENGLILAGYCGTPANWTKSTTVGTAEELYELAKTATGNVQIVLADNIILGNETERCMAVDFKNATILTIYGNNKTMTLKGKSNSDSVNDEYVAGIVAKNAEVTIKDLTIVNNKLSKAGTQMSAGRNTVYTVIRGTTVTYENIIFNGGVQVKTNETFKLCTFNEDLLVTDDGGYAKNGKFCMFVDHQYNDEGTFEITLEDCTFNASGYGCVKVAGNRGANITVNVKDCSFTNTCPRNSSTSAPKYDIKMTGDNINVNDLGGNDWSDGDNAGYGQG